MIIIYTIAHTILYNIERISKYIIFKVLKSLNILSDMYSLNMAEIKQPTNKYTRVAIRAAIILANLPNFSFYLSLFFNSLIKFGKAV